MEWEKKACQNGKAKIGWQLDEGNIKTQRHHCIFSNLDNCGAILSMPF